MRNAYILDLDNRRMDTTSSQRGLVKEGAVQTFQYGFTPATPPKFPAAKTMSTMTKTMESNMLVNMIPKRGLTLISPKTSKLYRVLDVVNKVQGGENPPRVTVQ